MSGESALRGFRYQFQCTLEYALRSWLTPDRAFTEVIVDAGPALAGTVVDAEIIDFEVREGGRRAIAAQVKSGAAGSRFAVAQAVRILKRLITNDCDHYLIITNQLAGPGLEDLRELLAEFAAGRLSRTTFRERLSLLLARSEQLRVWLSELEDENLDRLGRSQIVVDDRGPDEVDESLRELVRAARHQVDPQNVGWDAAGLFSKYLVAVTLDAAAGDGRHRMSREDLVDHLRVDPAVARAVLQETDWARHVLSTPRSADVARHAVLDDISRGLPTPVKDRSVPVCVLAGLSGIGKSSIATAWADDRADSYAEIFWIDASTPASIAAAFRTIEEWVAGRELRSTGGDVQAKVASALASYAKPWLMVLDNVADMRETASWIPSKGLGHVIVTTTQPHALSGPGITEVGVEQMTIDESVQLLSRRLAADTVLSEGESRRLTALAHKLNRWPLALEIAAAYLRSCLGGIAGIDDFEQLIYRSLDDDESVPYGYPRTLVQAIRLSWQQMTQTQETTDVLAAQALMCASLTGSRQIPLHILLAASSLDIQKVFSIDPAESFIGYARSDPPAGEILRAMQRYSLTSADEPLFAANDSGQSGPGSMAFTVQMNEIVQAILTEPIESGAVPPHALNAMAMVLQHWLSAASERRMFDLLQSLVGHAVVVSDRVIDYGVDNIATALLLGNTAIVLHTLGYSEIAVVYLSRELDFIRSGPERLDIYWIQAAAALAGVIIQAADDPHEVVNEASDLLAECLEHIDRARATNYNVTAATVRSALAATTSLLPECRNHERLARIREDLETLVKTMPMDGRPDVYAQLHEINTLIVRGDYSQSRALIEPLLNERDVRDPESVSLTRLLGECMVGLGQWSEAKELVEAFTLGAMQLRNYQEQVGTLCRNMGLVCFVEGVIAGNSDAASVFVALVDLFETSIDAGLHMQLPNKATGLLFSAFRYLLQGDVISAGRRLADVAASELPPVGDTELFGLIYTLATRLTAAIPPELAAAAVEISPRCGVRESIGQNVAHLPAHVHEFAIEKSRPAAAPLMILAATHWSLTGGQAPRKPIEIVTEFIHGANLLGLKLEVMEATVDIFLTGDRAIELALEDPRRLNVESGPVRSLRTYVLRLPGVDMFIDPTVPHLAPRYQSLTQHDVEEEFPVVSKIDLRALQSSVAIPRSRHFSRYRDMRPVTLSEHWVHRSERAQVQCAVIGLRIAVLGGSTLFGLPPGKLADVIELHPQLQVLASTYRR
ncbi:hypothetical protein [Nocardia sp. NPDC023988]|uniref:hypothetical protein n=1 Tax=unclassified Nocardia TaxID=2637762 RepID=UPI0033C93D74